MKRTVLFALIFAAFCSVQPLNAQKKDSISEVPILEPEKMPEFRGGLVRLFTFIQRNVKYPEASIQSGKEGRVSVRFIISKEGKVTNPEVVKGFDPNCEKEALRVINSMPKWIPGEKDGKPVAAYYLLPIIFKLYK